MPEQKGVYMEWMFKPLQRYADFSGRSCRKEYWMFLLGQVLVFAVLFLISDMMGVSPEDPFGSPLLLIFILAILVPSIAVQVRRFHDQDKSGWHILLGFIPIVGGFILLVFMCLPGTEGENSYGPDPKGADFAGVFE